MPLFLSKTVRPIWWICLGAILILLLNVIRRLPEMPELFASGDGDDLVRLQQVRDWLAGQSWFDTTQYRILPPEGISIHWSRYVDLGITAFLLPASWLMSQTEAELAAIILWPTLLGCLMVLVIGHANNRLLGPAAAVGALVTFLTWGKLGGEFATGRIDHHNIQIFAATAIFYLALLPGRRWRLGALAGALTAFSLAIGLEMLPFLAVIWGLMVLRHAFAEPGADRWLLGFCLGFAIAAPVLLAGQTPMSGWWVSHCDVLAPPVLGLAAIGIVATLAPVILGRVLPHPAARILLALAITAAGLWLAAPLLLPCLSGPYAQSSEEVRSIIELRITEALSAATLWQTRPELLLRVLMPPVVIVGLALGAAWLMRDRITRPHATALIQSFVVLVAGFVFAVVQIRAANLMTPALPFLAGFLLHAFMAIPRENRLRAPAALVLLLAIPAVVETGAQTIGGPPKLPTQTADGTPDSSVADTISIAYCRDAAAMAEIASLPQSVVFSSLNLGPAILVYTPHAITSASYHRSTAAFHNGIGAFASLEKLRDALAASRADYLVLCAGSSDEVVLSSPRATALPDWLTEVTADRQSIRVFKVEKPALTQTAAAP